MKTLAIFLLLIGLLPSVIKKPYVSQGRYTIESQRDTIHTLSIYNFNDTSSLGSHLKDIVKIFANISDRSIYYCKFKDSLSNDTFSHIARNYPSGDDIYSFVIALEQNSNYEIIHVYPCTFDEIIDIYSNNIIGVIHLNKNRPNQKSADFFICDGLKQDRLVNNLFTPTGDKITFELQAIKLVPGIYLEYKDLQDMYIGLINNNHLETLCLILNNKILINKIPQIGPLLE